ncbi:MAG: prepilin-type N-terminal cleavage/methylation domain-containing protein [Verrucomicrobiales bacterium]|nr:prepilin-type N-terminal cleavage/methylation domain-containing protein [Verrucomicrobiales bacterium]
MRAEMSHRCRGFSLFEIVVAMVILGLITTSIFSIVWQAGDSAAEIRTLDRRGEEVDRFVVLLRETIEGLPPDASFTITPAENSDSGYHELQMENTPTAFVFGEMIGSAEESFLALRPGKVLPDGTQGYDLALSRSDFVPQDSDGSGMAFRVGSGELLDEDENGRFWLPLLRGVTSASWRFWDDDAGEWLEEWTDDEKLPPLMEFSILDRGSSIPTRLVYEVPDRLVDPDSAAEAAETSVAAQSSSASMATAATAGGRPPNAGQGEGRRPGEGGRPGDGRGPRGGDRSEGGPPGRGGDGNGQSRPPGGGGPRGGGQAPAGGGNSGSGGGNGGSGTGGGQ